MECKHQFHGIQINEQVKKAKVLHTEIKGVCIICSKEVIYNFNNETHEQ